MDDTLGAQRRIGAIIQARFGSSRLPGKVLLPLPLNQTNTVLDHVVARTRRAVSLETIVVATSDTPADDAVASTVEAGKAHLFRGPEHDVLKRFAVAADTYDLDVVVRLTADNPAVDPTYIDLAVQRHLATQVDYTITTGLPLGTNLEVISRSALLQAHRRANKPAEREHVTPYVRNQPDLFRILHLDLPCPEGLAGSRLTIDYPSDYALMHLLFTLLPENFTLLDVGQLFQQHSWLRLINSENEQVKA